MWERLKDWLRRHVLSVGSAAAFVGVGVGATISPAQWLVSYYVASYRVASPEKPVIDRPFESFVVARDPDAMRSFLRRLHDRAPTEMAARDLQSPSFSDEPDAQWATISFTRPAYLDWTLGVQFVRRPDESSTRVDAIIRSISGGSPGDLFPFLRALGQALQAAAGDTGNMNAKSGG